MPKTWLFAPQLVGAADLHNNWYNRLHSPNSARLVSIYAVLSTIMEIIVPNDPLVIIIAVILLLSAVFIFIIGLSIFLQKPALFVYLLPIFLCTTYRIELKFFSITISELSTLLVWLIAFVRIGQRKGDRANRNILVFVVLLAVSALPSLFLGDARRSVSLYRDFIGPPVFLLGFLLIGLEHKQVIRLIKTSLIVAGANSVLGIIQYETGKYYFFDPASLEHVILAKIVQKGAALSLFGRLLGSKQSMASGLFPNGNGFAEYLIVPVTLLFAISIINNIRKEARTFWIILLITGVLAMIFTYGRAALISGLIGISIFVLLRKVSHLSPQRILYVSVIIIILLAVVYASGILSWGDYATQVSVRGRFEQINGVILVLLHDPLVFFTGGGITDYFSLSNQRQTVHYFALSLILYFGLPAFLIWFAFVIKTLINFVSKLDVEDTESKYLLLAVFGGLAAQIFIYQQTSNSILTSSTLMGIYYWLGIGTYLYRFLLWDSKQSSMLTANS